MYCFSMLKTQQNTSSTAQTAIKAFERIAELWSLSTSEKMTLLGGMAYPTYNRYLRKPPPSLARDTLERISYLLGIYKALHILIPSKEEANKWVKKPNKHFQGNSALDVMLNGSILDLQRVRTYLDAVRGGK
jgi:uncharacterized protein (DUF2384 family)